MCVCVCACVEPHTTAHAHSTHKNSITNLANYCGPIDTQSVERGANISSDDKFIALLSHSGSKRPLRLALRDLATDKVHTHKLTHAHTNTHTYVLMGIGT